MIRGLARAGFLAVLLSVVVSSANPAARAAPLVAPTFTVTTNSDFHGINTGRCELAQ